MRDEAEIRGHRRTYVGALPGRIIQGINQAQTSNPVFMLDEVDKIGADYRGDPSSALLEVLDPEQNYSFRDHYLGVPYDLSNVMFIVTANVLDTIQPAFLDRMEVIRLSGYTDEEKLMIAKQHLIPKQMEENGIKEQPGGLDRRRHHARDHRLHEGSGPAQSGARDRHDLPQDRGAGGAKGRPQQQYRITDANVDKFLGPMKHFAEELLERDQVGVATGLAWTAVGGDILFIEATAVRGKGKLSLTGQLGDVMKESAQAALTYARAHADEHGHPAPITSRRTTSTSTFPRARSRRTARRPASRSPRRSSPCSPARPVSRNVAMTGEVTLRGDVLPIGGVKEKVLAARAAKINTVILPKLNERDLVDVPEPIKRDMTVPLRRARRRRAQDRAAPDSAAEQKTTERPGRESRPLPEPEPPPTRSTSQPYRWGKGGSKVLCGAGAPAGG